MSRSIADQPKLLKSTRSRCPQCLAQVPADVLQVGNRVVMRKRCEAHGEFITQLAGDARFYHLSIGERESGGCGPSGCCGSNGHATAQQQPMTVNGVNADARFEALSSCIVLIEIVESCNLTCPTCYAASPHGVDESLSYAPMDDVVRRIQSVIERKGPLDVVQLSGGEPTLHPQFEALLEWCLRHDGIGYVLINTNGVRLARDDAFRHGLGALRDALGKFELYLQFDGTQEHGQKQLRGADLRRIRETAIDRCGAVGIPTTLAMTVTDTTIAHLGEALRFGLCRPHVRGITFQPMFTSGRTPEIQSSTLPVHKAPVREAQPITVSDVILSVVEQSDGLLDVSDFTPLPCGDPNCHTMGYLLRMPGGPVGLGKVVDLSSLQGFLRNRVNYQLDDLSKCGCETEPLGSVLKNIELSPELPFRLFIKPFMDAWTFDEDRIDRCCTHVLRDDGTLDSFCRHYLGIGRV